MDAITIAYWFFGSMVASWALTKKAMRDAERAAAENAGTLVNKDSNNAAIPVVYGKRKVGGIRYNRATSGTNNNYQYIVLVLCEGEIEAIDDIYFDDDLVTDSRFDGLVTINKYYGTETQAADQMLIDAGIGWTASDQLKGLAYLAVRIKYDQDELSSTPTITAVIRGKKVYDPRTSTTYYTANPALCLRDYLTNTIYGKGMDAALINDTQFNAAADACDVNVVPYAGRTTQYRFACNAIIDTNQTIMTNVNELRSGMRGYMPYQNGQYGLIIEDEGTSTFSFDEDNIVLGSLSIASESKQSKYNRVIATFTNPDANWQEDQVQYPPPTSAHEAEYLDEDDGYVLEHRVELPTVTDPYLAEDFAELIVHRSRQGLTTRFTALSEALNVTVGQIVDVTHSTPGWINKPFRVTRYEPQEDGTVGIEAIEHQDSIYPWSSRDERDAVPDTFFSSPFSVIPPTPTGVDEELYTTVNSKGTQVRAIFNWSAPNDAFVTKYRVEYRHNGDTDWIWAGETAALYARIDDITAGKYDFRVRSVSELSKSDWATLSNVTIAGLTAPPADITGFSIRAIDGQCHLSWNRITDLDVINGGYVRIRHSRQLNNAEWRHGQDIGEALAGTATHVVLPMLSGTYMIKAVDEGGRFSNNAVYAVTNVPNIVDFNAVHSVDEHPSFTGAKSGVVLSGSVLELDYEPQDILLESGFSLLTESGDTLVKEIFSEEITVSQGIYNFTNTVDLGGVYTSRVTSVIESSTALVTDEIDNRASNIDTWSMFDSGELEEYATDKVTATLEMRRSEDMSTWTAWEPFLVGDYYARGYEFRVVINSDDTDYNLSISRLGITIDMPDRTERAFDVATATGGTTITFSNAFKETPVVGITMQDADSGDYFRVTSKSRTGFTVQCYNSSNTGISRSINWIATGYGKEIV